MSVLEHAGLNNSTTYSRRGRWSAGLMAKSAEKLILHKCRQCNRTDRRPWSETDLPRCNHCESTMDPLEIRYKCLRCGHLACPKQAQQVNLADRVVTEFSSSLVKAVVIRF